MDVKIMETGEIRKLSCKRPYEQVDSTKDVIFEFKHHGIVDLGGGEYQAPLEVVKWWENYLDVLCRYKDELRWIGLEYGIYVKKSIWNNDDRFRKVRELEDHISALNEYVETEYRWQEKPYMKGKVSMNEQQKQPAAQAQEEQSAKNPEKKTNKELVAQLRGKRDTAVNNVFQSGGDYRGFLETMSRFPGKSVGNIALIHSQRPDASFLASFAQWNDDFNRSVRKGEHGIRILESATFTREEEVIQCSPDTGEILYDDTGNPIVEIQTEEIPYYRVATVFDAKQTYGDGKVPAVNTVIGNEEQYNDFAAVLFPDGMQQAQDAPSDIQQFRHAISALTSSRVNDLCQNEMFRPGDLGLRDFQAQSAAFVVAVHYGVDVQDIFFPTQSLMDLAQGKTADQLRGMLDVTRKAALRVIGDIDRAMDDRAFSRQSDLENRTVGERVYEIGDAALHIRRGDGGFDYDIYHSSSGEHLFHDTINLPSTEKISKAAHLVLQSHDLLSGEGAVHVSDVSRLDAILKRQSCSRQVGAGEKSTSQKPAVLESLKRPFPPRRTHDADAPVKKQHTAPQR